MQGGRTFKISMMALLITLTLPASGLTVSLAPAEDPAFAPPPDGRGSPLALLVSGCLGALFDAGYIATDASARLVARDSWGPEDNGLGESREGLVDYVIALYVEWSISAYDKNVLLPASARYRLVRVSDGKVLAEGSVEGVPDSPEAAAHEGSQASLMGAKAAEPSLKLLSEFSKGGE